jgi:predicted small integral membrane protein
MYPTAFLFRIAKAIFVPAIGLIVMEAGMAFCCLKGWFAMWQSSTWNGLAAAERILGFLMLTSIFLHLREEQAES